MNSDREEFADPLSPDFEAVKARNEMKRAQKREPNFDYFWLLYGMGGGGAGYAMGGFWAGVSIVIIIGIVAYESWRNA